MFIEWPSASSVALQLITPVDHVTAVAFEQPGPWPVDLPKSTQEQPLRAQATSNSHFFF